MAQEPTSYYNNTTTTTQYKAAVPPTTASALAMSQNEIAEAEQIRAEQLRREAQIHAVAAEEAKLAHNEYKQLKCSDPDHQHKLRHRLRHLRSHKRQQNAALVEKHLSEHQVMATPYGGVIETSREVHTEPTSTSLGYGTDYAAPPPLPSTTHTTTTTNEEIIKEF